MRNFNMEFETTLRVLLGPWHLFKFVTVMNLENYKTELCQFSKWKSCS